MDGGTDQAIEVGYIEGQNMHRYGEFFNKKYPLMYNLLKNIPANRIIFLKNILFIL